jgi:hypothetical protein
MARRNAQLTTADPAERSGALNGPIDPPTGTAVRLADVPAELVAPSPDGFDQHLFDDLGTDLVMSRFCGRVRKRATTPSVSMTDIYRHPTIGSLTPALTDVAKAPVPTRLHTHQYLLSETNFFGYAYLGAVIAIKAASGSSQAAACWRPIVARFCPTRCSAGWPTRAAWSTSR